MTTADPRRPATQSDVARAVGVSRTLVSFAFRGAPGVSEETRRAILEAAKRLGYRPNVAAADLARKRASAVGLHLLDLRNEVYADIFAGVREALAPTAHRIILGVARSSDGVGGRGGEHGGTGGDEADLGPLIEARVGVVIAATLIDPDERVRELALDVPIVSVARRVEGVDSVYSDDAAGSRAATEHLLALGHTRIAHITGPYHEGMHARRRAFDAAMHDAGLPPRVVAAPGHSLAAGEEAARALLAGPERPTAVVAHNDQLALGVREVALGLGLRVPEDLSLTGYDDSRTAGLAGIGLTSVDLGAHALGVAAGMAALNRLAYPNAPAVDECSLPRLVVRGSTAPPGRSSSDS
ncbi:LacI family DNA-binding transcriptional regulator [Sinomonas mesophila]|uniref:LacI family DNA-binding transcriptional regulator n=1 Tax=Sinomonas mesophila TaxID=1531955 RepID=UPI000984DFC1|nr:LacI family DNA-binding transcriptional regulator [Sinomonas mesophila]